MAPKIIDFPYPVKIYIIWFFSLSNFILKILAPNSLIFYLTPSGFESHPINLRIARTWIGWGSNKWVWLIDVFYLIES
jgi:hypothetical protein